MERETIAVGQGKPLEAQDQEERDVKRNLVCVVFSEGGISRSQTLTVNVKNSNRNCR